jgi:hypothetical protein
MRITTRDILVPAVIVAVLAGPTARGQDDEEPQGDSKSETISIGVSSTAPGRGDPIRDVIIVQPDKTGRRRVPFAVRTGTSERLAMDDAARAMEEIAPMLGAQEEQYIDWVHGTIDTDAERVKPGAVRLKALQSKLEITCPKEVDAGNPIAIRVRGTGNVNIIWHAGLIYPCDTDACGDELYNRPAFLPDNGQYEIQDIESGKAVEGADAKVASFNTYGADRGTYLGVRVENPLHPEDGLTFWVSVR